MMNRHLFAPLAIISGIFFCQALCAGPVPSVITYFNHNNPPAGTPPIYEGEMPQGELIQGPDGNYYGTTSGGGISSQGTVFQLIKTSSGGWVKNTIYDFTGGNDGATPLGKLICDASGNLYGTASRGGITGSTQLQGAAGYGTVFQLTPPSGGGTAWTIKAKAFNPSFPDPPIQAPLTDGAGPLAGLVQLPGGGAGTLTFYGTTAFGGSDVGGTGSGTIFEATLTQGNWTLMTLCAFDQDASSPHNYIYLVGQPGCDLLLEMDASGLNLYGTAARGGYGPLTGAVFKLQRVNASTTWTIINYPLPMDFSCGSVPEAGLIKASDGNYYGTAMRTGSSLSPPADGAIFQMTPAGNFQGVALKSAITGGTPLGRLLPYADGSLIGTTSIGGPNGGGGTILSINIPATGMPLSPPTVVYTFTGGSALYPNAGLIKGSDGLLYGTTRSGSDIAGGSGANGTAYQLVPPCPCGSVPPPACSYSICPTSASVKSCNAYGSVTVVTGPGCAWTATTTDSRIQIGNPCIGGGMSAQTSGTGSGTVNYTITDATAANPAPGIITIAGTTFTINQAGLNANCTYAATPDPLSCSGSPIAVKVTTGGCCTWTATTTSPFHILPGTETGKDGDTFTLYADPNSTPGSLSGTVMVGSQSIPVTQSGSADCTAHVALNPIPLSCSGSPIAVKVTTDGCCMWTATTSDSWLHIVPGTETGKDGETFTLYADLNAMPISRSGQVTVGGSLPISVMQAGSANCTYHTTPPNYGFTCAGGTIAVTVNGDGCCTWTASTTYSWLHILPGTESGNDGCTFTLSADANTSSGSLTGSVSIGSQTMNITQDFCHPDCTLKVSPGEITIANSAGGAGTITIKVAPGCPWVASTTAPSWIILPQVHGGSGNGTLTFTVLANPSTNYYYPGPVQTIYRSGDINIGNQKVTVRQPELNVLRIPKSRTLDDNK